MQLYVPCTTCGKLLRFPHEILGHTTLCPACGAQVLLSAVSAMTEPPPMLRPEPAPAPPAPATPAQAPPAPPISISVFSAQEVAAEPLPPAPQSQIVQAPAPQYTEVPQAPAAFDQIRVDYSRDEDADDQVQWDVPAMVSEPEHASGPPVLPQWSPPPIGPTQYHQNPAQAGLRPLAAAAMAVAAAKTPAVAAERKKIPLTWIAAGLALAAACVVVIVILMMGSTQSWEQQNRDQILSLKESAEDLALSGNIREAISKYESLQRLVAGHPIQDAMLQKELDRAWDRKDKLMDQWMAGAHPAAPVATTEPIKPAPKPEEVVVTPPEPTPAPPTPIPAPATRVVPPPALPPVETGPPRPKVRPSAFTSAGVTDEQIGIAIKKASEFLIDQFNGFDIPPSDRTGAPHDGVDALAIYALMQAGLAIHDDRLSPRADYMKGLIDTLRHLTMKDKFTTYSRAIRATAIALYNRPEDRFKLEEDVGELLSSQKEGAFTYTDQFLRQGTFAFWDNSNSQYGLLGIWSGAEVDVVIPESIVNPPPPDTAPTGPIRKVPVPDQFWRDVRAHWTSCQLQSGEWGYRNLDTIGRPSMTLAGIASLFVAQDYLDGAEFGDRVGRKPFTPALEKGLFWLEDGDNSVIVRDKEPNLYYTLYGLERVGLASGFKYFGKHDWYRQHAADLVASQEGDGSWGDVIDTSYGLLFLSRGRHPVMMNKLRFDGDWANRPRDLANLARFASRELERPLNWQVVPLSHDWRDWTDSPILYLASDIPPILTDADRQKIKSYIEDGGMLLTQADADSAAFTTFAEDLGRNLFPTYHWSDLPPDSPLWSINYKILQRPKIRILTNGSRILMMHWPNDITKHWQLRQDKTEHWSFELGVNLAMYEAGRAVADLPNRLQSDYIPQNASPPAASLKVAEVRYDGNWDPEPAAWPREARAFRQQTSLGINLENTDVADLATSKVPLAHLTGTASFNPTDAQIQAIKKYVEAGGILAIDPTGGPGEFYQSIKENLLPRAFANAPLDLMPGDHPLLTASADGMQDMSDLQVRDFTRASQLAGETRPRILRAGKGAIILFPLDITTMLLRTAPWPIAGYTPETAQALAKNLVLWAWDGGHDRKAGE